MSEDNLSEKITFKSLIAQSKGIEPLIISVFLILIYFVVSGIAFLLSAWYGRI